MTDAELANLEAEMMKLIQRSEELNTRAEGNDRQIDELHTQIVNTPAASWVGVLVKIKICIELQDNLVGEVDTPIWMSLLRSAYVDLQGR